MLDGFDEIPWSRARHRTGPYHIVCRALVRLLMTGVWAAQNRKAVAGVAPCSLGVLPAEVLDIIFAQLSFGSYHLC
jgi:hypothetical protein